MFLTRFLEKFYDKQVDGIGLAVFRVFYSFSVLAEVLQIFYFRELIFGESDNLITLKLLAWIFCIVLLIFGAFTRTSAVINYIFTLMFISHFTDWEYHYDYTMTAMNFLMIFIPVSRCLSIDRLRKSKKLSDGRTLSSEVSVLCYTIPILLGVGLVYFDSIFHKFTSPMWMNGLGVWKPASIPQITWWDQSLVLNQKWLVLFLGYLTLIFELIFVFTFWFKRMRIPLLIVGLGLHIGILMTFPIPIFAVGCATFYILLVPVRCWQRLPMFSKVGEQSLNPPSDIYKKIKIIFILLFFIVIVIFQSAGTYNSPLIKDVREKLKIDQTKLGGHLSRSAEKMNHVSRHYLGITPHGVFMDGHFWNYKYILAVTYVSKNGNETWLPIINRKGQPGAYITGRNWVKWSFRVNASRSDAQKFKEGLKNFTHFWAKKNHIDLTYAAFSVKMKEVEIPNQWEKDFLRKQTAKPWVNLGNVWWRNGEFYE